jgi:hypothetical protein
VAQRRAVAAIQHRADEKTAARFGVLMTLNADDQGKPMKRLGMQIDIGTSSLSRPVDRRTSALGTPC